MDTTATNDVFSQNEKLLYSQFKRKINTEAARAQIKKLEYDLADVKTGLSFLKTACTDSQALGLGAICVMPSYVKRCASFLGEKRSTSLVACVSFPNGGDLTSIKVKSVKCAVKDGADEVEVTAPISQIRDGNYAYVRREFKKLRSAAKHKSLRINVSCSYLTREEINRVCILAADCKINAVSLSGGNCVERIAEAKTSVKNKCAIKCEGGATVLEMSSAVDLGASIIGSKNAADVARAILTAAETEI